MWPLTRLPARAWGLEEAPAELEASAKSLAAASEFILKSSLESYRDGDAESLRTLGSSTDPVTAKTERTLEIGKLQQKDHLNQCEWLEVWSRY